MLCHVMSFHLLKAILYISNKILLRCYIALCLFTVCFSHAHSLPGHECCQNVPYNYVALFHCFANITKQMFTFVAIFWAAGTSLNCFSDLYKLLQKFPVSCSTWSGSTTPRGPSIHSLQIKINQKDIQKLVNTQSLPWHNNKNNNNYTLINPHFGAVTIQ